MLLAGAPGCPTGSTTGIPVKLTAAQSGPWHRPATYRPSRIEAVTHVEDPDKGHTKETQKKTNEFKTN